MFLLTPDGDVQATAMRTSRCSHLPGVPPERPRPLAPDGKTLPGGSGGSPAGSCPQYVMQVSAKDGQLLSSVVRTLATQRYVGGGGTGRAPSLRGLECTLPSHHPQVLRALEGRMSSPFNDRPMCRICHEGSSQEDLLSPCECTGTLGTIHRSCLEHWLSSSNTSYCELCHFRFAVERKPRPLVEVSTWGTSPKA
ncbi:hypothetical protein QYF61_015670 [Mycteria americana]|uniref:E3 ubiquitin-protein ligase MARCHF3 n=1 Tax=Mycteria americana TaxID=33587 RepID=A0AAN7N2A3_MYCAM|nr:hypothetical protein QYF61_015670 [Mycteria americana]